uniref:Interferon-induced protein 35 n=1 Tax=Xiphophorus maculatus TaxID=8083 RepID=A0A3B5PRY5_XIPMA
MYQKVTDVAVSPQKRYSVILEEQKDLQLFIKERQEMTQKFKQRTEKVTEGLRKDQIAFEEQITVFSKMPEKNFVFTGKTGKAEDVEEFEMKPHIRYPMEEGTALITFEEEDVATNILEKKRHKVDLGGECRIIVEAQPVHLLMPSLVEIDTDICPHRILVSNLPNMDTEMLLSKLEIHFSKSKHGGGEVESCDFLPDSGTVVIAFVMENIAEHLAVQEHHKIDFNKNKHTVRVTPFVNGKITNLKTRTSMCPRTVLLTGIPDVMDWETMQDMLEIHFQKNGNDGGEIEAFLYNPLGQQTLALFGSATPEPEEE